MTEISPGVHTTTRSGEPEELKPSGVVFYTRILFAIPLALAGASAARVIHSIFNPSGTLFVLLCGTAIEAATIVGGIHTVMPKWKDVSARIAGAIQVIVWSTVAIINPHHPQAWVEWLNVGVLSCAVIVACVLLQRDDNP
jgi:hypothetical protein